MRHNADETTTQGLWTQIDIKTANGRYDTGSNPNNNMNRIESSSDIAGSQGRSSCLETASGWTAACFDFCRGWVIKLSRDRNSSTLESVEGIVFIRLCFLGIPHQDTVALSRRDWNKHVLHRKFLKVSILKIMYILLDVSLENPLWANKNCQMLRGKFVFTSE